MGFNALLEHDSSKDIDPDECIKNRILQLGCFQDRCFCKPLIFFLFEVYSDPAGFWCVGTPLSIACWGWCKIPTTAAKLCCNQSVTASCKLPMYSRGKEFGMWQARLAEFDGENHRVSLKLLVWTTVACEKSVAGSILMPCLKAKVAVIIAMRLTRFEGKESSCKKGHVL